MMSNLGTFLAALVVDPALLEKLQANPEAVFADWGLSDEEIQCFRDRDEARIGELVGIQTGIDIPAAAVLDDRLVGPTD
jgi:hypothetical protein